MSGPGSQPSGDPVPPGSPGDAVPPGSSGDAVPPGHADEALLRALADAVALADPVPGGWERAAGAAGDWLALDAETAELTYDALDDVRPAGTAPGVGSERRLLRFDAPGASIEVELRVAVDALRLAGRVRPAGPWPVQAVQPDGTHATVADDAGSFQFDDLPRAPVSLVVERDPAVKTGWMVP